MPKPLTVALGGDTGSYAAAVRVAVLSSARWSSFWVSKQLVARALSGLGHEVLYVDPPVSPLSLLRQPSRRSDLLGPRHEQIDGVDVWRPLVVPGQNGRVGQQVNAAWLARGVAHRMPAVDLTIAFSLESRTLFRRMGGRRVYYCTDSLEDLPGADAVVCRERELELAEAADVTVACSLPLVDQLAARGVEATYLPHAVDAPSAPGDMPPPPELQDVTRPIIGYVGSLNFRLDMDLLECALRHGTLLVVGGDFGPAPSAEVRALLDDPRVVVVGHQHPRELDRWLAHLDLGLIPYAPTPFNRKSFPIKLLQYLAAGVPVVSTSNGATDEHASLVHVADDPVAFDAAIRDALAGDTPSERTRRSALARARSWTAVATELLTAAGLE